MPTVSSNGTANGVVWVMESSGTLHAYDAANVGRELYNSDQNRVRDALGGHVKFSVPTVADGKVFAGTQGALVVYGLLGASAGAAITGRERGGRGHTDALAPGSIVSIYGAGLAQGTGSAGRLSPALERWPAPWWESEACRRRFTTPVPARSTRRFPSIWLRDRHA